MHRSFFLLSLFLAAGNTVFADMVVIRQPGLAESLWGSVRSVTEVVTGNTMTVAYPSVRTVSPGVIYAPAVVATPVIVAPTAVATPVVTTPLLVPVRNEYRYGFYPQVAYPAHYYRWGSPHYGVGVHHYVHYGF